MNNENITITFKVSEKVYLKFKQICRAEKRIPAVVIRGFITEFNEENKECIGENGDLDELELEEEALELEYYYNEVLGGYDEEDKGEVYDNSYDF
ncbi:uncharacterized protein BN751_01129 [Coprococcus eutactus CAG:665]|nr:uncharacterized protein BN751_01129 [Coprococcus eutactus CAG:665]